MRKRVIHPMDLPTTPPVAGTIAFCLLLDRLHISKQSWIVWGTVIALWWLGAIYNMFEEKRTLLRELNGKDNA